MKSCFEIPRTINQFQLYDDAKLKVMAIAHTHRQSSNFVQLLITLYMSYFATYDAIPRVQDLLMSIRSR